MLLVVQITEVRLILIGVMVLPIYANNKISEANYQHYYSHRLIHNVPSEVNYYQYPTSFHRKGYVRIKNPNSVIPYEKYNFAVIPYPYPEVPERPNSDLILRRQYLYPSYLFESTSHKQCDGKKNLIDDIGIITFLLSIFSTFIGFGLDIVLSFKGNLVAIISKFFSLLFAIPSALLTFFNISNPVVWLLSNGLNILGIVVTLAGTSFSLDIGNFGLAIDFFFEILGIFGLILSIFSTFPESIDKLIRFGYQYGFGDEVKHFIENYGCHQQHHHHHHHVKG